MSCCGVVASWVDALAGAVLAHLPCVASFEAAWCAVVSCAAAESVGAWAGDHVAFEVAPFDPAGEVAAGAGEAFFGAVFADVPVEEDAACVFEFVGDGACSCALLGCVGVVDGVGEPGGGGGDVAFDVVDDGGCADGSSVAGDEGAADEGGFDGAGVAAGS